MSHVLSVATVDIRSAVFFGQQRTVGLIEEAEVPDTISARRTGR
jgi:hypothetical protein